MHRLLANGREGSRGQRLAMCGSTSGGATNLERRMIGRGRYSERLFLLRGEEEGGMRMVAIFKNSAGDGVKGREALVTCGRMRPKNEANVTIVIRIRR